MTFVIHEKWNPTSPANRSDDDTRRRERLLDEALTKHVSGMRSSDDRYAVK